ncbi:MAG: hypothetical protein IJJ26_06030, partial [Victivallales bacterium]|nr:hypothetical protein [Victivallales bacterium]
TTTPHREGGRDESFAIPSVSWTLGPNEAKAIAVPNRLQERSARHPIRVQGTLLTQTRSLPIDEIFPFFIEEKEPGSNLLEIDTFRAWGKGPTEISAAQISAQREQSDGTWGIRMANAVPVLEKGRYLMDFQARGKGTLRVMLGGNGPNKPQPLLHNFLSDKLSDSWQNFRKEYVVPEGTTALNFHFYEYKEPGQFQIRNLKFLRLDEERPVNRSLYRVHCGETQPILDDSHLRGTPIAADFTPRWNNGALEFDIRVKDKTHCPVGPAADVWQGDSVQLDFDLANTGERCPTVQINIGLHPNGCLVHRACVLPADDIDPDYRVGEAPRGVEARTERQGEETLYHIRIQSEALHPQLRLLPGRRLGFSILVNNNDGQGRAGYLQWSSGIGSGRDSRLFGELILPNK